MKGFNRVFKYSFVNEGEKVTRYDKVKADTRAEADHKIRMNHPSAKDFKMIGSSYRWC